MVLTHPTLCQVTEVKTLRECWKRLRGDRTVVDSTAAVIAAIEASTKTIIEQLNGKQPRSKAKQLGKFDDLERYPETKRPRTPVYLNIGAGRFRHPLWHNLDNPSRWYSNTQSQLNIVHDLMSDDQIPLGSGTLKVAYTSHVIEHLNDARVAAMFSEVHRIVRPGGVFRIACPDMGLEYDAYKRGDGDYFYWRKFPNKVLDRALSVERIFLAHFAAALNPGHPDPRCPKYSPDEVRDIFDRLPRDDAFEHFCQQVPEEVQRDHPGNHCNWFTVDKVLRMLAAAGFGTTYESRYGQSRCAVLRNTLLFDIARPTSALYVEAVK